MQSIRAICGLLAIHLLWTVVDSSASAQEAPALGYVFPPVVNAGSTAKVQLGGYDFTSDMQYFVHDQRVKLTTDGKPGRFFVPPPPYWFGPRGMTGAFPIPREIAAELQVPSDAAPGLVKWQVANANGTSGAGVFYVSDITEIVEKRWRDEPQVLDQLPIGVSGRVRKISEVDRYQFKVPKLSVVHIELMARQLGSNFHAAIEVLDSSGNKVADVADTEGIDCKLMMVADPKEQYTVRIYDVDFRGNRAFVYRLSIDNRPKCVGTFPSRPKHGVTQKVKFIIPQVLITNRQIVLENILRDVTFPADKNVQRFNYQFKSGSFEIPVSFRMGDLDEFPEVKRKPEQPPAVYPVPKAIVGTIKPGSMLDRYRFEAKKGETWSVQLESLAETTRLDLALEVLDTEGKMVANNDDLPGTLDAGLTFNAKADGHYTCVVRETSGNPGSDTARYRLAISQPKPDYKLTTIQAPKVDIGGKVNLAVKVQRVAGHTAEIQLRVEGLPEGVTVPDDIKIAEKKTSFNIPITVAADAASGAALIRVIGTSKVREQTVERVATVPLTGNLCPQHPDDNTTNSILFNVTMKPPILVKIVDKDRQRVVSRGTTYPCPILIERTDDCAGPIHLRMAGKQSRHRQGIFSPTIEVAADQTDVLFPIFMPEWLATDRTTRMVVQGVAEVKDPKGNVRQLTKKGDARITMILEGALMKIGHFASELTVKPGESFEIPLTLLRSSEFRKPAKIELLVPDELKGILKAEVHQLPAGNPDVQFKVSTTNNPKLEGDWKLTIKATCIQNGKWNVVSQTDVPVRFIK
ncbi:MAG: hypothetical protein CMJ78_11430 [Planctomycetaceae bacterium]|nr:hypothetical protein [Planctomycetaceae bacterium]